MKFWICRNKHASNRDSGGMISDKKPDKRHYVGYSRFYVIDGFNGNTSRIDNEILELLGVKEGECVEFNIERVENANN